MSRVPTWREVAEFCHRNGYTQDERPHHTYYTRESVPGFVSQTYISRSAGNKRVPTPLWTQVWRDQLRLPGEDDFWRGLAGEVYTYNLPPTPPAPQPLAVMHSCYSCTTGEGNQMRLVRPGQGGRLGGTRRAVAQGRVAPDRGGVHVQRFGDARVAPRGAVRPRVALEQGAGAGEGTGRGSAGSNQTVEHGTGGVGESEMVAFRVHRQPSKVARVLRRAALPALRLHRDADAEAGAESWPDRSRRHPRRNPPRWRDRARRCD